MTKLVYAHNDQAPAAGRREVWIDPVTGEWFFLTGDKDQGGAVNQTKRALKVLVEAPNNPPIAQDITLSYGGKANG